MSGKIHELVRDFGDAAYECGFQQDAGLDVYIAAFEAYEKAKAALLAEIDRMRRRIEQLENIAIEEGEDER